jgi:hypothetical protein
MAWSEDVVPTDFFSHFKTIGFRFYFIFLYYKEIGWFVFSIEETLVTRSD